MTFFHPSSPRPSFPDDRHLSAYLAGDANEESRAIVEAWRAQSLENQAALEVLQTAWEAAPRPTIKGNFEQFFAGVLTRIDTQPQTQGRGKLSPVSSPQRQLTRWKFRPALNTAWIATAFAMVLGLVVGYQALVPNERASLPAGTYTTHVGQRATVRLVDGTQVTLAPNSSIVIDAKFGERNRTLSLTGQAYFDVTSSTGHPFIVRSGDVTSRVLGTEFMIRHYEGERDVVIAVKSGKVAAGRRTPVVISANTVAHVTDSTATLTASTDMREYMEWTHGQLVFRETEVSDVVAVIGRWYGLTFQFADSSLGYQHLTGEFKESDAQESVLQSLKILLNVHMTFDGNVVTLTPNQSSAIPRPRPGVDTGWMKLNRGVGR